MQCQTGQTVYRCVHVHACVCVCVAYVYTQQFYLPSARSSVHSFLVSGSETEPSRRKFSTVPKCLPLRSINTHPTKTEHVLHFLHFIFFLITPLFYPNISSSTYLILLLLFHPPNMKGYEVLLYSQNENMKQSFFNIFSIRMQWTTVIHQPYGL